MKMKTIWKDQVELNVFYQEINVIDILKCKTCLLNIIKFFFLEETINTSKTHKSSQRCLTKRT